MRRSNQLSYEFTDVGNWSFVHVPITFVVAKHAINFFLSRTEHDICLFFFHLSFGYPGVPEESFFNVGAERSAMLHDSKLTVEDGEKKKSGRTTPAPHFPVVINLS